MNLRRTHYIIGGGLLFSLTFLLITGNQSTTVPLSKASYGVKVSYREPPKVKQPVEENLKQMTEDELLSVRDPVLIKGIVKQIDHVEIDFNSQKEQQSIVTITVAEVYRGELTPGEEMKVLAPPIRNSMILQEDTEVVSQVKAGMEGIFMPILYEETFTWEQNGARLNLIDISDYGFMDGERYIFLNTKEGLVFNREAYPSLENATTLEEVEAFIKKRIE